MRLRSIVMVCLALTSPLHADEPSRILLFPTAALSSEVPTALPSKLDELLWGALEGRAELQRVLLPARSPASSTAAPLQSARDALARARADYGSFHFDRAAANAEQAADLVEADAIPPGELETLSAALVQAAIARDAAGQSEAARADCARLMRVRPDLVLDRVQVPPRVVSACEAERARVKEEPVRRVRIITNPPVVAVSIDGVTRGTTPLTVNLTPGKHGLLLTPERLPLVRERLVIEPGAQPIERRFDLSQDPIDRARQALSNDLARRGPLPGTLAAPLVLGHASNARWLLVSGIEPGAQGGWRLYVAKIDVAGGRVAGRWLSSMSADLADGPARAAALAERIASTAPANEKLSVLAGSEAEIPWSRSLDFRGALFGSPAAAAPVLATASSVTSAPKPKPGRRKLWIAIGTTVGLVVAGGVTAGLALGLRTGNQPDQWVIHVPPR